jgi:hypothetical protein
VFPGLVCERILFVLVSFVMADNLSTLWGNLSLTEDEDLELSFDKVDLNEGETFGQVCVLGKLMADRMVSRETIQLSMLQWWKLEDSSITFKVLGKNLFLIEFIDPKDKERVLEGRPWVFEGGLFLVEDFDGTKAPSQFTFNKAAFWVRMIDLPLACMSREIGRKIGASVGVVEAVDADARGMGWGEFLRVKILMDLAKPLQRGRKINIEGKAHWIHFQYERLPRFCFQCGAICHGKSGCPKRSGFRQQEPNQYGMWLRAPSPTRRAEKSHNRFPAKKIQFNSTFTRGEGNPHRPARSSQSADDRKGADSESPRTGNPNRQFSARNNFGTNQGANRGDFGENMGGFGAFNGDPEVNYSGKRQKVHDFFSKKDMGENSLMQDMGEIQSHSMLLKKDIRGSSMERVCGIINENISHNDAMKVGTVVDGATHVHGRQHETLLGNEASSKSPTRYMGPLISDVAKSMQGNKLIFADSPEKIPTKKREREDLNLCGENISGRLEESRRKRNSKGDTTELESVAKGRKGGLALQKSGSGMAEAAKQPRQPR